MENGKFCQQMGLEQLTNHSKKRTLTLVSPDTKGNSKWIADQNIKYNTIKIIEENIGESHHIYG